MLLLWIAACTENTLVTKDDEASGPDSEAPGVPALVVEPERWDFGEVLLGQSAEGLVTLRNAGEALLTLDGLELVGASAAVSVTLLGDPALEPGEAVDVALGWAPASYTGLDDALRVQSNDPLRPSVDVSLSGLTPAPAIFVDPTWVDFGVLSVGEASTARVTVVNLGDAPLTLGGYTFAPSSADLTLEDPGLTEGAVLEAGESTQVELRYAPADVGTDEASFIVYSDDPASPETLVTLVGEGEDPIITHDVELWITADDAWRGWMDGVEFTAPGQNGWGTLDRVPFSLDTGSHTLAIYATDTAMAISGFISVLYVDGAIGWLSGDAHWLLSASNPGTGWEALGFDDSAWVTPSRCSDTSPWGSVPSAMYAEGAVWVWGNTNCRVLGEVWLRLDFELD